MIALQRHRAPAAEAADVEYLACDLSQPDQVTDALAASRLGAEGISGLVACTASLGPRGSILRTDDTQFVERTALNIASTRAPIAAVARLMAPRRSGSIVLVNSVAARRGLALDQAYATAKGALRTMALGLAVDLARYRIRVNSLIVGFVETPLSQHLYGSPIRRKTLEDRIPLGRLGSCADIDGAIELLLSDAASYVTGSEIVIDGGYSLT